MIKPFVKIHKKLLNAISLKNIGYFPLVEDLKLTESDPQQMVSEKWGFLPRETPLWDFSSQFGKLDEILKRAIYFQKDGTKGLVAYGKLGETVLKELPLYDVTKITNTRLMEALRRDYQNLAATYLLEPVDLNYQATGEFGLGRDHLPENIAVPLCHLAEKLQIRPWLEYSSHVLLNWQKIDPDGEMTPENLTSPRDFIGSRDEFWFKIIHVHMERNSGKLVRSAYQIFRTCENKKRSEFDSAIASLVDILSQLNIDMERMWEGLNPKNFNHFRSYLLGSYKSSVFPKGIEYKGVWKEPKFFRGSSAANDSMIPMVDNILEITEEMPDNHLTAILREFREYRPINHIQFVQWTEDKAKELGIKKFALENNESALLYLACLDQIGEFRERHIRFVKEYIVKMNKEPVATGGSPIDTWLANQFGVITKIMKSVEDGINIEKLSSEKKVIFEKLRRRGRAMRNIYDREVENQKSKPGSFEK